MAPPEHRRWMDNRIVGQNSRISNEFFVGVEELLEFASQLDKFKHKGKFACPCLECKCEKHLKPDEVRRHLYEKGFMPDYYHCHNHGQKETHPHELAPNDQKAKDHPCPNSAEFNDLLAAARAPLCDGGEKTVLCAALELLHFQSNHGISDVSMDETIELMNDMLPENHRMPKNLYQLKKLVCKLGYLKTDDDKTKPGGDSPQLLSNDIDDEKDED